MQKVFHFLQWWSPKTQNKNGAGGGGGGGGVAELNNLFYNGCPWSVHANKMQPLRIVETRLAKTLRPKYWTVHEHNGLLLSLLSSTTSYVYYYYYSRYYYYTVFLVMFRLKVFKAFQNIRRMTVLLFVYNNHTELADLDWQL